MRRLTPSTLALIAGVIILGLVAFLYLGGRSNNQDKLGDARQADARKGGEPNSRCGSPRTYDAIKRELFRQAADTRGSDQATFDKLAAYAVVRMERPVMTSQDGELGTIRCSGRLSLDLPPGVAVVGGRRTLTADVDYTLQPAADGSGDVVILEGVDSVVVPLATLGRTGAGQPLPNGPAPAPDGSSQVPGTPGPLPPPQAPGGVPPSSAPPQAPPVPIPAPAPRPTPPVAQPEPAPAPRPTATARPSFNCRYAKTRGEIAVCGDAGLAALDRQMANQNLRAVSGASAGEREMLQRSRTRFLRYRDSCRSDACIAESYRGRMAEIRDIVSGNYSPPR